MVSTLPCPIIFNNSHSFTIRRSYGQYSHAIFDVWFSHIHTAVVLSRKSERDKPGDSRSWYAPGTEGICVLRIGFSILSYPLHLVSASLDFVFFREMVTSDQR